MHLQLLEEPSQKKKKATNSVREEEGGGGQGTIFFFPVFAKNVRGQPINCGHFEQVVTFPRGKEEEGARERERERERESNSYLKQKDRWTADKKQ